MAAAPSGPRVLRKKCTCAACTYSEANALRESPFAIETSYDRDLYVKVLPLCINKVARAFDPMDDGTGMQNRMFAAVLNDIVDDIRDDFVKFDIKKEAELRGDVNWCQRYISEGLFRDFTAMAEINIKPILEEHKAMEFLENIRNNIVRIMGFKYMGYLCGIPKELDEWIAAKNPIHGTIVRELSTGGTVGSISSTTACIGCLTGGPCTGAGPGPGS